MLLVADQPLSQSHKHDEQSDSANSEFAGDGPEEYEEPDACKGVFDSLCTLVCRFVLPYEFFRKRLTGCESLFGKAIACFPVLVAEEEEGLKYLINF